MGWRPVGARPAAGERGGTGRAGTAGRAHASDRAETPPPGPRYGRNLEAVRRLASAVGNAAFAKTVTSPHPGAGAAGPPGGPVVVLRDAAQDIRDFRDWGGLNLKEEGLAGRLVGYCRSGQYAAAAAVLRHPDLESHNRDDVARAMLESGGLVPLELIQAAHSGDGRDLLALMRAELTDWWGFVTAEEVDMGELLGAVLGDVPARNAHNRRRIRALAEAGGTDLEKLANLFADDLIVDEGTVSSRLTAVLGATEHLVIPGLQTGVEFGDTGFVGSPTPGGPGFRDPHPSSRNQVGHFLTAVGLRVAPEVVSRPIPAFGSIRAMVGAPAGMSDEEVVLRLTIGHEKAPDPASGLEVFADLVLTGFFESLEPGPPGETDEQRNERIARAASDELQRQINEVIAAFRRQFQATTDDDIAAWNEALGQLQAAGGYDAAAMEGSASPLNRIAVGTGKGNSMQDLRLSLVGYQFGQLVRAGGFADRGAAAAWLRRNLGGTGTPG